MLALSVSISTSSSPRLTSSPSDFSHLRIVPSSIESDRRGIATSAMPGSVPANGPGTASARGRGRAGRGPAWGAQRALGLRLPGDVAADRHHADDARALVAHGDGLDVQVDAAEAADPLELGALTLQRRAQQRVHAPAVGVVGERLA